MMEGKQIYLRNQGREIGEHMSRWDSTRSEGEKVGDGNIILWII